MGNCSSNVLHNRSLLQTVICVCSTSLLISVGTILWNIWMEPFYGIFGWNYSIEYFDGTICFMYLMVPLISRHRME